MLPDNQTVRQHFRGEVPTQRIKFSIKMLTILTKTATSRTVAWQQALMWRKDK